MVFVTPFVGVWIETIENLPSSISLDVTPFVGVWIETNHRLHYHPPLPSHPSWVCGLKQAAGYSAAGSGKSHPSWVCGLKLIVRRIGMLNDVSHPSWVCGLKHEGCGRDCRYPGHTLRGCVD